MRGRPARRARRAPVALVVCLAAALVTGSFGCASDAERRDAHLAEAETHFAEGRFNEGMLELRSALRLDPQNAEINFRIGEALRPHRVEDAIFFYREAHRLDPERLDAPLREAELVMFDDADAAEELVEGVLAREPAHARGFLGRSKLALVRGDTAAALRAALAGLEIDPEDEYLHQQVGKIHMGRIRESTLKGEQAADEVFRAAIDAFETSASRVPEELRASILMERARVFAAWPGHTEEAVAAHRGTLEAAQAHPSRQAVALMAEASASFAQQVGDDFLLKDALEILVEHVPESYWAWSSLATYAGNHDGDPIAVLDRMLAALPDDPQVHLRYARELAARNHLDAALAHLEEQANHSADPAELLGASINLLRARDRHEEADARLKAMQARFPDHPRTTLAEAQQLLAVGELEKARKKLRRLTGSAAMPAAYHLLGVAEYRSGDSRAALEALEQALEPGPRTNLEATYRLLARVQSSLGDCPGALRSLGTVVANRVKLSSAEQALQARCFYEIGRPRVGYTLLQRVLAGERPPALAALQLARREGKARPAEVRAALERAAELYPDNSSVLLGLARLELREKHPDRAIAHLNKAVEGGFASPDLLLQRARVLAAIGDVESAQREGLRAFEAQPSLPGAGAFLVSLYAAQGRQAEVIQSFEEADAVGALRPPARYLLAQLHMRAGNADRALELLEAVTAERDDMPQAKNDLAYMLATNGGDLGRAQTLAQEAAQGLGDRSSVADTLGFVYLQRGLHEPALDQFNRAIELMPEETAGASLFHYHRGLALSGLDRQDDAASAFEKALSLNAELEEAARALEGLRAERDPSQAGEGSASSS